MHRSQIKNIHKTKSTTSTHPTQRYHSLTFQINFTIQSSNTPTSPNIKLISIKSNNLNLHLSISNKLKKYQNMLLILVKISIKNLSSLYFIIKHPFIRNYGNLTTVAIIFKELFSIIKILSKKLLHKAAHSLKKLMVCLKIPPKLR